MAKDTYENDLLAGIGYAILIVVLSSAWGCASPTAPSTSNPAPVQFAVSVYGHISQHAVSNEAVTLVLPAKIAGREIGLTTRTDASGIARWQIEPGQIYAVIVRGQRHFEGVRVNADAQWLLSIPE